MGERLYDGFMSYSHAADDLLAPRLQAGLQRFAKPWWRRRALRVFRDESSLSANPHLWASITDALDESEWFVLLLSPDAAGSDWVGQEVAYWVANRGPDRIIPVVTDGDFAWDGDVTGDAVPSALRGVFPDEPRWVDLRFARGEVQLDLKHPRFADAVADVASAMRGVAKDELASEEVRQHRRTVRTAWAAGVVMLGLAVAAVGFGAQSVANAEAARSNAEAASANATEAQVQAAAAEANAAEADRAAAEATEQAERARSAVERLLDFVGTESLSAVRAPLQTEIQRARPEPLAYEALVAPPDSPRLDFLQEYCVGGRCTRDAVLVDEAAGVWVPVGLAGQPFHIRHGFPAVSGEPLTFGLSGDYDLRLYATRVLGPDVSAGWTLGITNQLYADGRIVETSDACGPDYGDEETVECDRLVFDFPDGLPPGRYQFRLEWHARCRIWFDVGCPDPESSVSVFTSTSDIPFYDPSFSPFSLRDDPGGGVSAAGNLDEPRLSSDETYGPGTRAEEAWPFDPWAYAEPLP